MGKMVRAISHTFSPVPHAADEGAVNLQSVRGESVQVTQRRIARTESSIARRIPKDLICCNISTAPVGLPSPCFP